MGDLTTEFLFNRWRNNTPGGHDTQLERIIPAVTAAISTRCGRTFDTTIYREWINGSGTRRLLLSQWPVTAIQAVGVGASSAFTVGCSGAQFASVETTATGVVLRSIDNTGTETTSTLALASYKTIALLRAAIAAVSGWTVTNTDAAIDSRPSTLVQPYQVGYCATTDTFDVQFMDDFVGAVIVPNTNRMIERTDSGLFPWGRRNCFVWYTAGYTMPADDSNHAALSTAGDVPADLTEFANACVKAVLDTATQDLGAAQSGSMGEYSYVIGDGARAILSRMMEEGRQTLLPHMKLTV